MLLKHIKNIRFDNCCSKTNSQELSGRALRCSREELSNALGRNSQEELSGPLRNPHEEISGAHRNAADDHHVARPPSIRACKLPCHQVIRIPSLQGGAGGRGVAIQY